MPPIRRLPWTARLYLWATVRLYNELAWAYDPVSWLVSAGQWARWRRMALDYASGPRVLEVGFGTGELLIEMARRGIDAWGLELSPAMQRVTGRKIRHDGQSIRVHRIRGRAQHMPFVPAGFDTILSTFPTNYVLDPLALHEFARVLRPGGRLVVVGFSVIANNPWLGRLLPIFYGPPAAGFEASWRERTAAAGLRATIVPRRDGLVTLPVMIAEKMA